MHRSTTHGAALSLGRANVILFAAATAAATAAAFGVADIAGYERLAAIVRTLHLDWLAVCFGGQVLAYLGYVLAVRAVARAGGGPRLSFSLSARTVVAGFGVYAAAHTSGGFSVDYWALRRAGVPRREALARVLGLGALEYAVLAPAALVSALVLLAGEGGHVQDAMTLPWLAVIPGIVAAAWVSSPKRAGRLAEPGDGGRVRHAFAHAVAGVTMLRSLLRRPVRHAGGLAGAALYWVGDIACLWAALAVVGVEISMPALIVAYGAGYVLSRRSLPSGGAGVVEVLMTFALAGVGVPLAPAFVAVIVYRLFNFWLPILPALAILPSVRELRWDSLAAERTGHRACTHLSSTGPRPPADAELPAQRLSRLVPAEKWGWRRIGRAAPGGSAPGCTKSSRLTPWTFGDLS